MGPRDVHKFAVLNWKFAKENLMFYNLLSFQQTRSSMSRKQPPSNQPRSTIKTEFPCVGRAVHEIQGKISVQTASIFDGTQHDAHRHEQTEVSPSGVISLIQFLSLISIHITLTRCTYGRNFTLCQYLWRKSKVSKTNSSQ